METLRRVYESDSMAGAVGNRHGYAGKGATLWGIAVEVWRNERRHPRDADTD